MNENLRILSCCFGIKKNLRIDRDYMTELRSRHPTREIHTNSEGVLVTTDYEEK